MTDSTKAVLLDYTNHAGERRERRVQPLTVWFGFTAYHPDAQWLLRCIDLERTDKGAIVRDAIRDFACRDIHAWKAA